MFCNLQKYKFFYNFAHRFVLFNHLDIMEVNREKQKEAFGRLLDIMDRLRAECPWDKEQTMASLRPNTIEEVYELSDAIMAGDCRNVAKELGDVLLHVVFYSKILEENGEYDVENVIDFLCDKLIYRHPHVFSATEVSGSAEVVRNWEQLKMKEKDGNKRILSGVPVALPALIKAYRMQEKARAVGFDWEEKSQVWDKVREELGEFEAEIKAGEMSKDRAEGELGDVLFAVVNAARLYGLDPDTALDRTCEKFRRRFTYLEEHTIREGRNLKDMSLAEMDEIWDEAKAKGL